MNIRSISILVLVLSSPLAAWALIPAQDHDHGQPAAEGVAGDVAEPFLGDPYLLDVDPVSGAKLGELEQQVVLRHEGREMRFASEETAAAFGADPNRFLAPLDARLADLQRPHYPLATCPVSGETLGSMGEPFELVHRNRLVRLCCAGCRQVFLEKPEGPMNVLQASVAAAQREDYPLATCPVSGKVPGAMGEPFELVIGNRLLRLCCAACADAVKRDPLGALARLDAARAGRTEDEPIGEERGQDAHGNGDGHGRKANGCCGRTDGGRGTDAGRCGQGGRSNGQKTGCGHGSALRS